MQKYKVFFNEKRIIFVKSANITLSKLCKKLVGSGSVGDVLNWMGKFSAEELAETVVEHSSIDEVFRNFRAAFLQIDAAGGVVINNGKLLFIFRNGKWDLPKGKIEKGENPDQAALREVEEECGISKHSIVKALPSTYHVYKSPYKNTFGQWVFKETFWYEMSYDGNLKGTPQLEEGITEVRWFSTSELNVVLENTYENLKELIRLYLP